MDDWSEFDLDLDLNSDSDLDDLDLDLDLNDKSDVVEPKENAANLADSPGGG